MSNLSIASVLEKNRVSSENAMVIALDIDLVDPVTSAYVMTLRIVNYDTDLTESSTQRSASICPCRTMRTRSRTSTCRFRTLSAWFAPTCRPIGAQ